jgi:hypothetical protein
MTNFVKGKRMGVRFFRKGPIEELNSPAYKRYIRKGRIEELNSLAYIQHVALYFF